MAAGEAGMSRLERHQRDWDDLARLDPLWAIASTPEKRFGGWDEDEFMASGRKKVAGLLERLDELGVPARRERALDFGCGVGRLTLPLAEAFDEVTGVDIAPAMLEQARRRAAGLPGVRFVLNESDDLELLAGERFDLVYTGLVLQHLPSGAIALRYLSGLAALVAPGGVLVAQVPVAITPWLRLQPGRRAYDTLRRLGVSRELLYRRLRLQPMRLTWVPRADVDRCLTVAGLRILHEDERRHGGVRSVTFYAAASW
jgi:SAM-dependent methyltransferase